MTYKPPRDHAESIRLLEGAARDERVKSDWSFLGHSAVAFGAVILIVVCVVVAVAGWF